MKVLILYLIVLFVLSGTSFADNHGSEVSLDYPDSEEILLAEGDDDASGDEEGGDSESDSDTDSNSEEDE